MLKLTLGSLLVLVGLGSFNYSNAGVEEAVSWIADSVYNSWQAVINVITTPINTISNFFLGIGDKASSILSFLSSLIDYLLTAVRTILSLLGKFINYVLGGDFWDGVISTTNTLSVYLGFNAYYLLLLVIIIFLIMAFTFTIRLFTMKSNFTKHVK